MKTQLKRPARSVFHGRGARRSLGIVLAVTITFLGCTSDGIVSSDDSLSSASDVVAAAGDETAAPMSKRGSWNGWHIHDLPYGSDFYTDETGLRHEDYNIWPVIWPDYPSEASPVVYCIDGAEKMLVGGDGGSKLAAGTCRNDLYIIQIQLNASDAPAPAGWTALSLGNGFTLYYRLTPR